MGYHCHSWGAYSRSDAVRPSAVDRATVRASNDDRQKVIDQLRTHTGQGRLTLDEFSERVGEAYAATTLADLDRVLRELPARPVPGPSAPRPLARVADPAFRGRLQGFLKVAAILVLVWALTGAAYFWPVWPLAWMAVALLCGHRHRPFSPRRA
jgi:hypothetical protein